MPSAANPKLEKQASTEAVDNTPIKQAIIVIEHKIRNLEKRKGKLEGYRDLQRSGKELNADQKVAVAKYDEVINTIEFARELIKSFGVISTASEKEAKKIARKEVLQRVQQNVQNIREVLAIQDILSELGSEEVRSQFLTGENGAVLLTEDDFNLLDKLYEEITPKREEAVEPFNVLIQRSSEHILSIIEGKPKEAFGRTYDSIRDLLKKIESCEYFNQSKTEVANDAVILEETENAETNNVEETEVSDSPQPEPAPVEDEPQPAAEPVQEHNVVPVQQTNANMVPQVNLSPVSRTTVNAEAPAPNAVPAPAFPPPQHQQLTPNMQPLPAQVIPQVPPGIVPVVAGPIPNPALPHLPTVQSVEHAYFTHQQFMQQQQQQRPITEMIGSNAGFYFLQESELDSPEVAPPVSGPQLVTGAPRNTPPPPPGHAPPGAPQPGPGPIPTQTYTNQQFTGVPPIAAVFPGHPVAPPQQVPVPEMGQHIPGFANPNQPIAIPVQQQAPQQQTQIMVPQQQQQQPPHHPSTVSQPQFGAPQQQTATSVSAPFPVAPQSQVAPPPAANASPQQNQQPQTPPKQEDEPATGDVPESTDWCQSEPEPAAPVTTNAWHNRQQQNQVRDTTPDTGARIDWTNDTWSGQGDGYRGRGGRGRGGRFNSRGGGSNFRGRGGNTGTGNYREQNGGARPSSGGTYYRNNDQQNNSYYQNQNGGSNFNNRDGGYQGGYQSGFKSRGGARGAPGANNGSRPGQRTGQAGGNVNNRGGPNRTGGNNTQYVRREHAAAAKQ